jgi:hypothetical protein
MTDPGMFLYILLPTQSSWFSQGFVLAVAEAHNPHGHQIPEDIGWLKATVVEDGTLGIGLLRILTGDLK